MKYLFKEYWNFIENQILFFDQNRIIDDKGVPFAIFSPFSKGEKITFFKVISMKLNLFISIWNIYLNNTEILKKIKFYFSMKIE